LPWGCQRVAIGCHVATPAGHPEHVETSKRRNVETSKRRNVETSNIPNTSNRIAEHRNPDPWPSLLPSRRASVTPPAPRAGRRQTPAGLSARV
jgi:hypothetical protein